MDLIVKNTNKKNILNNFKNFIFQEGDSDSIKFYIDKAELFFNELRVKERLIYELAYGGLGYSEIAKKLGYSFKDIQNKIYGAYRLFIRPDYPSDLYRLKVIRRSLGIKQEEIATKLKKSKDSYSKYERSEINFDEEGTEEKIIEIILNYIYKSNIFAKIKNGGISKEVWEMYFNQAGMPEYVGFIDRIIYSERHVFKTMLFKVLEDNNTNDILIGKYMGLLIRVSNIDVFEEFIGLTISKIKSELEKETKEHPDLGMLISFALNYQGFKGIKLNEKFKKAATDYLRINWLRKFYGKTITFIADVYKNDSLENLEFYKYLLFGLDELSINEIKNINNLIDSYYESLKKL